MRAAAIIVLGNLIEENKNVEYQRIICVYKNYICTYKYIKMDTKLTLKLSEQVIERAKEYARSHKVSLSKLIESYLDSITKQESSDMEITPLVKDLSGVMELPADYNSKKEYGDYLEEKYK